MRNILLKSGQLASVPEEDAALALADPLSADVRDAIPEVANTVLVPLKSGRMARVPAGDVRAAMGDPLSADVDSGQSGLLTRMALENGRSAIVPIGDVPAALRDPLSRGGNAMRMLVDRAPISAVQHPQDAALARMAGDSPEDVDALAREMDRPYPREDTPEDVDALAAAFDASRAPAIARQNAAVDAAMRRPAPATPRTSAPRHPVMDVQSVPSTVALASPLGGAPLPSPRLRGEGARYDNAAPAESDTLADAQRRAWLERGIAGLSSAGTGIANAIGAFSGAKPMESGVATTLGTEADQQVKDYLQRKQAAEFDKQKAQEAALRDPNSPESKRFQAAVARALPGVYKPEDLSLMGASDKDTILDLGKMRATLDERAKERADMLAEKVAETTAKTTEAEKQRTFEAEQNRLSRGLQREIAGMRTDAAGSKAEKADVARSFKNEADLRKELANNPATKQFQDVSTAFDKVSRAAKDPSAAGDMAMIFGYMKMLDPNSSVREGEYATAANAGNIGDAMIARYNSVINGQKLSPDQRADFLRRAREAYDAQKATYDRVANQYRGIATSAGVAPERVAMPLGVELGAPNQSIGQQGTTPEEDEKALTWAKANPKDPRAARILRSHGVNL